MFHLIQHALAEHILTELRNEQTSMVRFRELVRRLGMLVGAEALRDVPRQPQTVTTPCGVAQGSCLAEPVVIVPVLRAGLTYAEGVATLLPEASIGHIGLYRDEQTHRPVPYFSKLPGNLATSRVLVVDPMLATGYSAVAAVETLIQAGANPAKIQFLALVAAPEGVNCFEKAYPDIGVWAFALDERLNDKAYIVPGLGDAGDRLFGTC